jgi:two-component system, chemotaxis family, chemotaxis protein CheY
MFDAKELKIVLGTLTQRRSWLLKQLELPSLEAPTREEYIGTIKTLDSALHKLANLASSMKPAPAQQPTPPVRKAVHKPQIAINDARVLIAEDDPVSADLLRGILEDMGIQHIEIVKDGRAAVFTLQNCSPAFDIVLCDWDMPEMTGIEVRKAVKNLAKLRDTHFIMVTALSEATRIKEAISHGVTDYVVKPIDIDILERKIKAALAGSESGENTANKQQ